MRIRKLDISAYGPLVGRSFEVGEGLTVFFGRNEEGKTTLKRFVETMLFGFDDDDVERFSPWHADNRDFGGELGYELSGGAGFLVQRYYDSSPKKRKSDRERAELLGGLDGLSGQADLDVEKIGPVHVQQRRAIFRTVFSVDLSALVALNELERDEQEEMARVFFRELATAGEVANPREVEKAIRHHAERICKFDGSRKHAGVDKFRREEFREAKAALDEARRQAEEAEIVQGQAADYQARRDDLAAEKSKLQAELSRRQSIGPAAETYRRLQEAKRELEELDSAPKVDESLVDELKRHLSERAVQAKLSAQLERDRESAKAVLARIREQLSALPDVEARAAEIETLARTCDVHEDLARRVSDREIELTADRERLTRELSDLTTSEDPLACRALEMTSASRGELVNAIEQYDMHMMESGGNERQLSEVAEQVDEIKSRIDQISPNVPDDFPEDFRPEQLRELMAIDTELAELRSGRQRIEEITRRLDDDRRYLKATRKETAVREKALRAVARPASWHWLGTVLAMSVVFVLSVVFGVYFAFVPKYELTMAGAILAGLSAWSIYGLWRQRHEPLQAGELAEAHPLLKSLEERIRDAESSLDSQRPELEKDEQRLAERYGNAGLDGSPDASNLRESIDRLAGFNDSAADYRRLIELRSEHERLTTKDENLRSIIDDDNRRLESERGAINEILSEIDLSVLSEWNPRWLRDRYDLATSLADRFVELQRSEETVGRQREQVEGYLGKVVALAASISGPDRGLAGEQASPAGGGSGAGSGGSDPSDRPYAFVRHVEALLVGARSLRERADERQVDADQAAKRHEDADAEMTAISEKVGPLLDRLGLASADDLPALTDQIRQRREHRIGLEGAVESLSRQFADLRKGAGLPEDWVPREQPETDDDGETPSRTPDQLAARMSDLEQEINQVSQEVFRLEEELAKKRSATPVAVAEGAYEGRLDQLAGMYEQFDGLLVAQRLLERAMQRYRQQRQPGIVRAAQAYLEELTAGRYGRLQTDLLDSSRKLGEISIVPPAGQPREARYFSRGAREQVYLALRLALADELSRDERLPLVLDDVLVNFDRARFESTTEMLARLGGGRQILFLTCHQAARDALAHLGATVCEL